MPASHLTTTSNDSLIYPYPTPHPSGHPPGCSPTTLYFYSCHRSFLSSIGISLAKNKKASVSFPKEQTNLVSRQLRINQKLVSLTPRAVGYPREADGCGLLSPVTRSHKFNDKDHAGLAEGTAVPHEHVPKFFAKHGHVDADPKKAKKNGGGKANWGGAGEEVVDTKFNFTNSRRHSNSSDYNNGARDFKTKFEFDEPEPVFEESVHGPEPDDELTKIDTSSSSGGSLDEEKAPKDA